MTNKELLKALYEGKKIAKESWCKGEYIRFDSELDLLVDEDGNEFDIEFGRDYSREYGLYTKGE